MTTPSDLFLGIDVGTSAAKAILIDAAGACVAESSAEYPLSSPQPLWSEQNPTDWWDGVVASIREILAKSAIPPGSIRAIGLTGQMHGLTLLDKSGRPLRPAILWNDQRTARECAEITAAVGASRVLELTGNPILTGFTAPKIAWVKRHEPELFSKIDKVLLPKDYVRYRLSNAFFGDVSDASGTSLFDVGKRAWSAEMLDAVGVSRNWLAEITESTVASTRVSPDAAAQTGLIAGTPIVAGGGDQAAGAVGCGIVAEGHVSAALGTSGVLFAASDRYRTDPQGRLHAFCHAVPGKWHLMGVMLSAAGSFRWFRDAFCQAEHDAAIAANRDVYDDLTAIAAKAPAGSEGLIFLPYLSGERTPHADPLARGAFVGLTVRHSKAHLIRAVLEGVAFGLRDSLELMRDLKMNPNQIRCIGGGARSRLWRQIFADVFEADIVTLKVMHGAAYGAALLAAVGGGAFKTVDDASRAAVEIEGKTASSAAVPIYRKQYPVFRALYPALRDTFHAQAALECV